MFFPPTILSQLLMWDNYANFFNHIDIARYLNSLFEFIATGKIPFTDITIAYEPLATGVLVGLWLVATYNFTFACLLKINQLLIEQPTHTQQEFLDSISL